MDIEAMRAELEGRPRLKEALGRLLDSFQGDCLSVDFMVRLGAIAQVLDKV